METESREALRQLKPFQARAVIEDLREGSVPLEHVLAFTVGRANWLRFIEEDLEQYIAQGGAKVRFVNGDYGDGKTHFMSVISHLARQKDFASSFVVLTREIPIHKFELVYREIVRQLQGKFEGKGIRQLVDHWLGGLEPSFGEEVEASDRLLEVGEALRGLPGMDLNFANALVGLASIRFLPLGEDESEESRREAQEQLFQWLEGGKPTRREIKRFQIYEVLSKSNARHILTSLIAFLKQLGHQGMVLLMDELETVLAQSTSVRNAAYENVRLFIDNTAHVQHLHLFFSIIPDVLTSEKGFRAYDALWSRVRNMGEGKRLNYRGVLVDLHRTPLATKELEELGGILKNLHEVSYRWEAAGIPVEKHIKHICQTQKKMGVISEVRLFIKQVIRVLDMAEQGNPPDEDWDLVGQMEADQQALVDQKVTENQPQWDS